MLNACNDHDAAVAVVQMDVDCGKFVSSLVRNEEMLRWNSKQLSSAIASELPFPENKFKAVFDTKDQSSVHDTNRHLKLLLIFYIETRVTTLQALGLRGLPWRSPGLR
jgi:hypothetical protein